MSNFRINILRIWPGKNALLGEVYVNGKLTAMSLELPWRDNASGISSIPEGSYGAILRYDKSRDGFFTIQLNGTGPRSGIQIHVGNRPDEISGCILIGLSAKYDEERVGASREAIQLLKQTFYGAADPVSTPDVTISVVISSLPRTLQFYPSENDRTFSFVYDNGFWYGRGSDVSEPARYREVVRDAKWIISRSEEGGAFNGRYVRWGTLGGTPFQVSKDLKGWKTLAPDELLVRDPAPTFVIWAKLAARNVFLKDIVSFRHPKKLATKIAQSSDRRLFAYDDGYGDEDGREDGRITYDFDDDSRDDYEGDEEITVDLDEPDEYDDRSDYGDDYRDDDRGGDGRDE